MNKYQEEKIMSMYTLRRPIRRIAKETGLKKGTVTKWLKENKIWTGHNHLLQYFDEYYFDTIDTEEKAYWLGLITAKGYLGKTNGVGVELKIVDREYLEKLRKALQSEIEVKTYGKEIPVICRFVLHSKHIHKILMSYFKSTNKFEWEFPELRNKELTKHLIRGYFDGNGEVKDGVIKFAGIEQHLKYIESISECDWEWTEIEGKVRTTYEIRCNDLIDCSKFLDFMYRDATLYLERKYPNAKARE